MPVDLTHALEWTAANSDEEAMLDALQPNIVKAHVREFLSVLFLQFGDQAEGTTFLGDLLPLMKSAKTHLQEVQAHKAAVLALQQATTIAQKEAAQAALAAASGTPYVGVGLTARGYAALGIAAAPADPSFAGDGMREAAARTKLSDPPFSTWEAPYRQEIHAVVLIGDAASQPQLATRNAVEALLPDSITVLAEETGESQRNANGDGIEQFGYVDGRSQPLFLVEDVAEERAKTDGTSVWNPEFPLEQVIVGDPAAPDPTLQFGSYFVFRKLEQNVRRFKQGEEDLAGQLGLEGDDAERAGAMIVGRFEDGTPLTLQRDAGAHHPVMNDFTYASDPDGAKCPFHAHIRKTNPRGSSGPPPSGFPPERDHLMARRGQTYGVRVDDPNQDLPPSKRPTGGVGLLFMAFNHDLGAQFEFTQALWANNAQFPPVPAGPGPGVDGVMGQGTRPDIHSPTTWSDPTMTQTPDIAQAVRMKGGQYFFMPSLAFLGTMPSSP